MKHQLNLKEFENWQYSIM